MAGLVNAASRVNSIQFRTEGASSIVEIISDSPVTYEKQENTRDHQLVLDLKDTILGPNARRKFDTSSFNSPVKLISPYQIKGTQDARVVLQLRESSPTEVSQAGNVLKVGFQNSTIPSSASAASDTPGATQSAIENNSPLEAMGDAPVTPGAETPKPAKSMEIGSSANASAINVADTMAKKDSRTASEKTIDTAVESNKTKQYIGKHIDINVQDVDILQILQVIGEASGFNVIVGNEVAGKVTLSLQDAPWDQVLDLLLTNFQLGAERNNNVLRITTLAKLTSEKQAQIAAKKAIEDAAPRVTRVFTVSYAKLSDLGSVFSKFASVTGDSKTLVYADERTNSLIVRDIAENVDRMRKLMEILDTQTPQILIEGKVIEATETGANSIAGALGLKRQDNPPAYFSGNGGALNSDLLSAATGASGTGAFGVGLGPALNGILGSAAYTLNATLSISEKEANVRIVSSPRVVVLNKESSSILSGTPVLVKGSTVQNGIVVPTDTVQSANLSLTVSPTVTNEGSVILEVSISNDVPIVGTGIAARNIKTKVVVDSGSTLVIGGVYTANKSFAAEGVPVLRDIPILGALFGSKQVSEGRTELLIFITPRILNEREAGLSG